MRLLPFLILVVLFSAADASPKPRSRHVYSVHESRHLVPARWSKRPGLDKQTVLPVRINLKQSNLDQAEELLMAVSHPASPKYGHHYSPDEVMDLFAPPRESIEAVKAWVVSAGVVPERVKYSHPHGALFINMTVTEVEDLRQSIFLIYDADIRLT